MGVPAFFRWLSKKYPSIVVHCVEEKGPEVDGVRAPVDTSLPNPNDYEFDNLYLDMNGIIHPCCHPENKPAPKNEDEMMVAIFEYIDRIFSIVRPRKLLYMAIDGVAPRAKMNQQRSRRFRASKETKEKAEEMARIRSELMEKGALLPPEKEKTEHFDSNCITPGTEFMANLSICLRYYIADRLNNDPGWKNIKVILSDANVPGEGEHKIMDYIRKQRASPHHDPNTKHCLNGADADLIMLGLATHELHFTIIREEFKPNQKRPCEMCGQIGKNYFKVLLFFDELPAPVAQEVEFIFIRLNVLREYLERELRMEGLPFPYSFERCLDDWVFMCFFVGNDFLPHLPSLEIREGAIDRLVGIYKRVLPRCGGYLAKHGIVDLSRVQMILQELGYVEDEIFKKRQENEVQYRKRLKANKEREKRQKMRDAPLWTPSGQFSPHAITKTPSAIVSPRQEAYAMRKQAMSYSGSSTEAANKSAAANLRAMLVTPSPDANTSSSSTPNSNPASNKRKHEDEDEEPKDDIRLWEAGWKGRYYKNKFQLSEDDEGYDDFRKKVAHAYVEGLCWVLLYYYQGCPSWKWFYPYHYAPFASDFRDLASLPNSFEKGTQPFKPLEQLMGVFPAASGNFLPPTWRELMSHPESPIIDFYPLDFEIDLNGKKYAWQGVALLPFVDEKRLLGALSHVYPDLTELETKRNNRGKDRLFLRQGNPVFDFFVGLYEGGGIRESVEIVANLSGGMSGKVEPDDVPILPHKIVHDTTLYLVAKPLNKSEVKSGLRCRSVLVNFTIRRKVFVVALSSSTLPPSSSSFSRFTNSRPQTVINFIQLNKTLRDNVCFNCILVDFSVLFTDPVYDDDHIFKADVLPEAVPPARVLKPEGYDRNAPYRPVTGMNPNRTSFAQIDGAGRRMLNFHGGEVFRFSTPRSHAPPFRSHSGPPQNYPRHGHPPHSRSILGTPPSSRDYNDPRRNNHYSQQVPRHNSGSYQGNRPTPWSQRLPSYRGPGPNQPQFSRNHSNNPSRDPRQHQDSRGYSAPARDDRRQSYPLSNYRYRP
ncbi:5'-3' exoribonuclease 2-like [Stylophora pistillata]|uniref:5'-3' exoribonuclease 2-like n=1 Tax=Stylophora pistillata TaxID=50429 RepID=UPI000C04B29F|nr:5'-3' exoribonuclease 2-like [Stylophora pistillata]